MRVLGEPGLAAVARLLARLCSGTHERDDSHSRFYSLHSRHLGR